MRRERCDRPVRLAGLIGRVAIVAIVCLVLLSALWSTFAPNYTRAVVSVSRPLFRLVERPDVSIVQAQGDEIWIYRDLGGGRAAPFTWFDRYTFFAVIPLLSLMLATPGLTLRKRVIRVGAAWFALFIVHVAYLIASVELAYAAVGLTEVGAFGARTLDGWQTFVRILWEAAPVLIWVSFTAGAWNKQLRRIRLARRIDREPTPVRPVKAEG